MVPIGWVGADHQSPVLSYPYERSMDTLHWMQRAEPVDEFHGHKLRFINPITGGYPLSTIGAFIQLLPKGLVTAPYQSTDATIYSVIEGEGESRIGDITLRWRAHDVFVVPSWAPCSHHAAAGDVTLFSFSDRPVQEALGLWRESRGSGWFSG